MPCLSKRNAQHKSTQQTSFSLSVVLVDKVYNHFQHGVLLLSTAFRYHQGERHQGIVCDALGAVFIVKDAIAIEKPQKQRGGDTFVAIAEGMVLGDKVKQHGSLLFNRGIRSSPPKVWYICPMELLNESSFSLPKSGLPPNFS